MLERTQRSQRPLVTKFSPEVGKVYLIEDYTLLHVLEGIGSIEVDFKHYLDWDNKLIFLDKGQYIKFLADGFSVRKITFDDSEVFASQEFRVLFKHLISLGYINFNECSECQQYLANTVLSGSTGNIIDVSSQRWFWQNPFDAKREEYHLIFDVKEVIDREYHNHLNNQQLSEIVSANGYYTQALVKDKLGISVKQLLSRKRLLESQRELAFSDKSVQEIAYELGFNDPAYFGRVFRNITGSSPGTFREHFTGFEHDYFLADLMELLGSYHTEHRSLDFYADKLNVSVKTLSRKVKERLNITLGQLIRAEVIKTAKAMLREEASIKEVSIRLGFEEQGHFSAFFRHYAETSPMEFKTQKYQP